MNQICFKKKEKKAPPNNNVPQPLTKYYITCMVIGPLVNLASAIDTRITQTCNPCLKACLMGS